MAYREKAKGCFTGLFCGITIFMGPPALLGLLIYFTVGFGAPPKEGLRDGRSRYSQPGAWRPEIRTDIETGQQYIVEPRLFGESYIPRKDTKEDDGKR